MDTFQALGDPTRRRIMEIIATKGHVSSSDISKKFSITAPAISQHLKVLREARLVDVEKSAQRRIYSINIQKLDEVEEWTRKMKKHWNTRFNALEKILEAEKKKMTKKRGGDRK